MAGCVALRGIRPYFFENTVSSQLKLLAFITPTSWMTVAVIKALGINGKNDLFRGIVCACATALTLDAISLSFYPKETYGLEPNDPLGLQLGGALLYGFATTIGFAFNADS
jgi:hypothetical protein